MDESKTVNVFNTVEASEVKKSGVKILDNIAALLKVKSLLTIIMTIVFAVLSLNQIIESKDVLTVFLMIVSFYFGTQSKKE